MQVQGAAVPGVLPLPHLFIQGLPEKSHIFILYEEYQKTEFLVGQFHIPACPGNSAGLHIHGHVAGCQQALRLIVSAENSLHSGHQFHHVKGFHQIVVRAQAQTLYPVLYLMSGSYKNHRYIHGADVAHDIVAIHSRQHDIKQYQVKKLVLYTSGVGFFEHEGTVEANDSCTMNFTAEQLNDLLKTLVIRDFDGGSIGPILYPAQNPLDKALEAFPINVSGNLTRAALLQQLRGAEVKLELKDNKALHGGSVQGTVLGVEVKASQGQLPVESVSLLTADGIEAIDLETIRNIAINKLGMVYAGEEQVKTYDDKSSDYVRQYSDVPTE